LLARSLTLLVTLAAASVQAAPLRVVFVDNRAEAGGIGTAGRPFSTLDEAIAKARDFEVLHVAETDQPYLANITLRRGQMLIGSAYGLDALQNEFKMELDVPPTPAVQGPGPLIRGSVGLSGDNVVAGVTIETSVPAAIHAVSPAGPISVFSTYIRTSSGALGVWLNANDFPATFRGGGITASGGGGVTLHAGRGEVLFDRFDIQGTFTTVIDIRNRMGPVLFRGKAAIEAAAASQPAVTIADCAGRVDIDVPLRITASARGLSIVNSSVKIGAPSSRVATTGATALEVRDSAVEAAFADVSASGGDRGIVIDKLRGSLAIAGGTIRDARVYGITISQSSGIRLAKMKLIDNGSGDRSKCDDAIEVNTNLRCGAALHLRHVSRSEFEDIAVAGGKQIGLNANNLEDVSFSGLDIRGVGDEPGEAAVVIDEVKGTVKFARCTFEDSAGGAVIVAQQFNSASITFDVCTFGALARPSAAEHLIVFRTSGSGRLDAAVRYSRLHDSAASAIGAVGRDESAIQVTIGDSNLHGFGRSAIEVAARDRSRASLTLRGTTIATQSSTLPAVDVSAVVTASACADLTDNQISTGGASPSRFGQNVAGCSPTPRP
jgi:hypothetical protein